VTRVILTVVLALLVSSCAISPRKGADGPVDGWKTTSTWHGRDSIKLSDYDRLVPVSELRERDFPSWVRRDGIGTPAVLWRAPSEDQPFVSPIGTALPVTYLEQDGRLQIYDSLNSNTVEVGGSRLKLAVNYTAPLAYMRKQGDLKLPVVRAMIKTDEYDEATGIYRFEPVDPTRIPVIFVHGIKSSPSIWKNMVNRVRADDVVRKNYQFWSYSYPTGVPILYSGMRLREEIQRMQELYNPGGVHPQMDNMVIIGHSMGGLVTELQLKDSDNAFWPEDRPRPEAMGIREDQAKVLSGCVFFEAIPQIKRAIFIATPHRGSDIAVSKIGGIIAGLIKLPTELTGAVISLAALDPFFAKEFGYEGHIPNSVDDLRPNSDFLKGLRGLPFKKPLPIHSIIALGEDPLTGPVAERNDGLVSYGSAHLDEAVSEKTVLSNHRAPNHPGAITEVVRILHLHVKE
jgi:pimeloyl-ACP methyl ester carboxylesterase